MSATRQSLRFSDQQRAEFAESYIAGLAGARPSNDICVVRGFPVCHLAETAEVDDAAMSAIHGLIEM